MDDIDAWLSGKPAAPARNQPDEIDQWLAGKPQAAPQPQPMRYGVSGGRTAAAVAPTSMGGMATRMPAPHAVEQPEAKLPAIDDSSPLGKAIKKHYDAGANQAGKLSAQTTPFLRSVHDAAYYKRLYDAATSARSGKPTETDLDVIGEFLADQRIQQEKSGLRKVAETALTLPAFAVELGLTGPLFKSLGIGGKAAAEQAVSRSMAGLVGHVVKEGAKTAALTPQLAATRAMQGMVPDIAVDAQGNPQIGPQKALVGESLKAAINHSLEMTAFAAVGGAPGTNPVRTAALGAAGGVGAMEAAAAAQYGIGTSPEKSKLMRLWDGDLTAVEDLAQEFAGFFGGELAMKAGQAGFNKAAQLRKQGVTQAAAQPQIAEAIQKEVEKSTSEQPSTEPAQQPQGQPPRIAPAELSPPTSTVGTPPLQDAANAAVGVRPTIEQPTSQSQPAQPLQPAKSGVQLGKPDTNGRAAILDAEGKDVGGVTLLTKEGAKPQLLISSDTPLTVGQMKGLQRRLVDTFGNVGEVEVVRTDGATEGKHRTITIGGDKPPPAREVAKDGERFPDDTVSSRRAHMEQLRSELILGELPAPERESWSAALGRARAEGIPEQALRIADEVAANPRALTTVESAGVTDAMAKLVFEGRKLLADAANLTDPEALRTNESRRKVIQSEFDRLTEAQAYSGTKAGQQLAVRKFTLDPDLNIVNVLSMAKTSKGKVLTDNERAHFEKQVTELERLKAQLAAQKPPSRDEALQQSVESFKATKPKKRLAERVVLSMEKEAEKSRAALREMKGRLFSGVDPEPVIHLAKIAAAKVARGGYEFAKFTKDMVAEFGEKIKPYLDAAWERSRAIVNENSPRAKMIERAKTRESSGDNIGRLAQRLARTFVEDGVSERNALVDAVHRELRQVVPDITRDQAMDAISGYGDYKPLSKDEVSNTLRDLKGQLQQVGKLRDLQARIPPKRSGLERRTPTTEEQNLIREVNDLKKELNLPVTDPETQLRSSQDAIKTRLTNEIAHLEDQMAKRQQVIRDKSGVTPDAETLALRERLKEVRRDYDEMFNTKATKDARKLELMEKSLDRSIAELQRQIDTGDIYPKAKGDPLHSPGIDARREELAELRKERQALRDADTPRILQEREADLNDRIAELQERLKTGDFAKKPQADKPTNRAIQELEYKRDRLEQEIRAGIREMEYKSVVRRMWNGLGLMRIMQTTGEMSFVGIQGGLSMFGHPVRTTKSAGRAMRSLFSDRYTHRRDVAMENRPNRVDYHQAKLPIITPESKLTATEDAYLNRVFGKLAGSKWLAKHTLGRFNRAARVFLNEIRADAYDAIVATNFPDKPPTLAEKQQIAKGIGTLTGRAHLGAGEKLAGAAAELMFSPRFFVSRVQALTGQPLWGGTAATRKALAKEYGRIFLGAGVVYGLAKLAGAEIEEDPRSSDFLKMKFGNTRIDLSNRLAQLITFGARLFKGETKRATGEIAEANRGEVLGRFLRTKLAPVPSLGLDMLVGKNVVGEEFDLSDITADAKRVSPITYFDIAEAIQEQGVPKGAAMGLAAFFGASVQTYGQPTPETIHRAVERFTAAPPKRQPGETDEHFKKRQDKHKLERDYSIKHLQSSGKTVDDLQKLYLDQRKAKNESMTVWRTTGKRTELGERLARLRTLPPKAD